MGNIHNAAFCDSRKTDGDGDSSLRGPLVSRRARDFKIAALPAVRDSPEELQSPCGQADTSRLTYVLSEREMPDGPNNLAMQALRTRRGFPAISL
jgi:hypothetical protein